MVETARGKGPVFSQETVCLCNIMSDLVVFLRAYLSKRFPNSSILWPTEHTEYTEEACPFLAAPKATRDWVSAYSVCSVGNDPSVTSVAAASRRAVVVHAWFSCRSEAAPPWSASPCPRSRGHGPRALPPRDGRRRDPAARLHPSCIGGVRPRKSPPSPEAKAGTFLSDAERKLVEVAGVEPACP